MAHHLVMAVMDQRDLSRQSEFWRHDVDAHWQYLLSQATSVELLDAFVSSLTLSTPRYSDILVMEMVKKQDDERDAGLNPTRECEEGDASTEL